MEKLLKDNSLDKYYNILCEHNLDLDLLSEMDITLMKSELKIEPLGDRLKLKQLAKSNIKKEDNHMDILNLDLDCYNAYLKLISNEEFNKKLFEELCCKYPSYYIKKVISNFSFEEIENNNDLNSFLSQGLINTIRDKQDITNKYSYQNNIEINDECIKLYDAMNIPYIHNAYNLSDEELELPCLYDKEINYSPSQLPNQIDFIFKINNSVNNMFDGMDWNNIIIAGGLLTSIAFNYNSSNSDIDIFFIGKDLSKEYVNNKIKHIHDIIKKNTKSDILIFKTPNTITLYAGYPYKYVQIVLRICTSVCELLSFFDLDCCAIAYDGKDILTIPRFIRCIKTRSNFIDVRKLNNIQFCNRIYKYFNKGFRFCFNLKGVYLSPIELKYVKDYYDNNAKNVYISHGNSIFESKHIMYEYIKLPYDNTCNVDKIKSFIMNAENIRMKNQINRGIIDNENNYQPVHEFKTIASLNIDNNFIDDNWRENISIVKDFIRKCYSCKQFCTIDTAAKVKSTDRDYYDKLCDSCYDINNYYKNKINGFDFSNKVVIITGGRINIGHELALYFLNKNANVITTTRFPKSAYLKFKEHENFNKWKDNLVIYGLDFRDRNALNTMICDIREKYTSIDILINCAAQTIKRSAEYYRNEINIEKTDLKLIGFNCDKYGELILPNIMQLTNNSCNFIEAYDTNVTNNSWTSKLNDISDTEIAEVHLVNAIVPFILINKLKDMMIRQNNDYSHIINVSSPEGLFNSYKNTNHPHTNMAKASLNMLTRTSAKELFDNHNIIMNCVDTGWVTNMIENNKNPPLKTEDAVHRVLFQVIQAHDNNYAYGKFYQEFKIVDW